MLPDNSIQFSSNQVKKCQFQIFDLTLASLEIIAKKESDVITIFSVFSQASIIRDLRMGTWTKEEDFSRLTSQRKKSTGGDRIEIFSVTVFLLHKKGKTAKINKV